MEIINFFKQNFFGVHLPFKYRIYMVFYFQSFIISLLTVIINILLERGVAGILLQCFYVFFCVLFFFFSYETKIRLEKPLLIFICFINIPFMFFHTGGYDGTALLFSLMGIFCLCIVFDKNQRYILVTLNILVNISLCIMQYFFPHLVAPHESQLTELIDLVVAIYLSCAGMAIITVQVNQSYVTDRNRIAALAEKLNDMSNRDALTGAYNRRYIQTYLERELELVKRTGKEISILVIDIDHFKKINDTFGHRFGDQVLIKLCETVSENLRKYDILVRMGGEEFLVVLNSIDFESSYDSATRIKDAVSNMQFENGTKVTVSIGLAQAKHEDTTDTIIDRADSCLYKAKRSGRNAVVTEEDQEELFQM